MKSKVLEKPHKKLDVWQKSVLMVRNIYELTKTLPPSENYGLINQMRRSVISVPADIAEGAASNAKKEFIHFLHTAQGSLSELDTLTEICLVLNIRISSYE